MVPSSWMHLSESMDITASRRVNNLNLNLFIIIINAKSDINIKHINIINHENYLKITSFCIRAMSCEMNFWETFYEYWTRINLNVYLQVTSFTYCSTQTCTYKLYITKRVCVRMWARVLTCAFDCHKVRPAYQSPWLQTDEHILFVFRSRRFGM